MLAGPTAVGKTGIAIQLAQALHTAIISADSRQCYQGMAIGTAQPSAAELQAVQHYFIDCLPPTTEFSAACFERFALEKLDEIFQKKNTAIVCGGTGLYIKALCKGLDEMPAVAPEMVVEIQSGFDTGGIAWLQQMLLEEDPLFFDSAEQQNPARLMRALSFRRSTGQSITSWRSGTKKERPFRILKIGLELPREALYSHINQRVDAMMGAGLLPEAQQLLPLRHLKNLQTVGYTELFDFMDGKCTLPEAIEKIKQHSRNYAKRQMTWFRKDAEIHWLRADAPDILPQMLALMATQ